MKRCRGNPTGVSDDLPDQIIGADNYESLTIIMQLVDMASFAHSKGDSKLRDRALSELSEIRMQLIGQRSCSMV